jgi:HrpA-like RNA helicase
MTDGMLLNFLRNDPMLLSHDIVMVDEAHERSINIDLTLGLLKQAQKLRKEKGEKPLKVIVTSATIEEEKFTNYFNESPSTKIEGRMFPVETKRYLVNQNNSFAENATEVVRRILDTTTSGDVLIFMPGEDDIKQTIEEIETIAGYDFVTFPLYGAMNRKDQDVVFSKNKKRKIVVATNIAETSVTIDGIVHVVDSGYAKQKNYNPITGISSLELVPVSKANMKQRAGRAGRTAPGVYHSLVSEEEFNARPDFQKAELLRSDLGTVVLHMKEMGIKDVEGFDFIEKPSRESIHDAVTNLTALGALDGKGDLTDIGKEMARFQLRPDLARMLIEAKHVGCLDVMTDFCSILSASKQIFYKPKDGKNFEESVENQRKKRNQDTLKVAESDPLTLLNVWKKWNESGNSRSFAYEHLLNVKALEEIGHTRAELLKALAEGGVDMTTVSKKEASVIDIIKCILAGEPDSVFTREGKVYQPVTGDPHLRDVKIFPGSAAFSTYSSILVALNIQQSSKQVNHRFTGEMVTLETLYAKMCQPVTLEQLQEAAPNAITEKKTGQPYRRYDGTWEQTSYVYFNGHLLTSRSTVIQEEHLSLMDKHGSYENIMARVLYSVAVQNDRLFNTYEQYRLRSRGKLPKLSKSDVYEKLFTKYNIKEKEDLEAFVPEFTLTLEDLISKEDLDRIEKEFPTTIAIAGRSFAVEYRQRSYFSDELMTIIHVDSEEDASVLLENKDSIHQAVPTKDVGFISSDYITRYSIDEWINARNYERELEKRRREQQSYNDAFRPQHSSGLGRYGQEAPKAPSTTTLGDLLRVKLNSTEGKATLEKKIEQPNIPVEKKEVVKEMVEQKHIEKYKRTIADVKEFLSYLKSVVGGLDARYVKNKDNMLTKIKDINSDCNALVRTLDSGVSLTVEGTDSKIREVFQAVKVIMKNTGTYSKGQVETMFDVYVGNRNALYESAARNDLEVEDALQEKIKAKSVELSLAHDAIVTDEEADNVIIEIV